MSARPKVLLVDDRPGSLLALETQLRGVDAEVLKAGSGRAALDLLLEHEVAVALVDVQMPEIDGFELAELMRGSPRTREIPIMFVTAGLHDRSRMFKGYEAGAVDFLIKPIEPWVLASKVGVFLELYRQKLALVERVRELEATQAALRESEARFRSVLEGSQDLIYRMNAQTGHYEYIGPRAEVVVGFSTEELLEMDVEAAHALVHPEDREAFGAALLCLSTDGKARVEYRFRTKSGEYRWMSNQLSLVRDAAGRPLYRDGNLRDITRRKRMEDALRESEARFRQLAETVPQLVFEVSADGDRGYFNTRWTEYTGRPAGGMATRFELVHPDDRDRVMATWANAVAKGGLYECEYRFRRHDGQYRWFLVRAQPFKGESGAVERWFGTATDIHDLKRAQDALSEVDQRKTEFLAVLSHELRNPLAPIKNSLYILDRAAPGGEQANHAKEVISRQVDHLANLINDLLDVTRITRNKVRLQKELLDLNETVLRTAEDHRSLFEQGEVRLAIEPSPTPITINADRTRVAQVVSNLLQNAAKFTPPGGCTRVSIEASDGRATVRVADDGLGMTPATLERLFQPFAQATQSIDRSGGGLGLGLALVKGLVELHGGGVTAHSDGLGRGSEFVVELPCDLSSSLRATSAREVKARGRRRVLIIEDNADAAESLRQVLAFDDHLVTVARDGAQGIQRAREFRPDVVLCDIGLPGMDGYEVARALRADPALKPLQLVALSGYALPGDLKRAHEAGFDLHLAKPPDQKELEEILATLPDPPP